MATKSILRTKILLRNDIKANWDSINPVLGKGEVGIESDTQMMKLGDNSTPWKDLPYFKGDVDLTDLDASNVYFNEDITLAGDYDKVGNVKLSSGTLPAKNKTVAELFADIFTKEIAAKKNADPSVYNFSVTNNGSGTDFEAGSTITPKWTASFSAGDYNYKSTPTKNPIAPVDSTGVKINSWEVTQDGVKIGSVKDGTGPAFVIGDSTVNFKITANHSAGNYALSNLNKLPSTDVQIAEGSKFTTDTLTSYRKDFASGTTNAATINSALIRGLRKNRKHATGNWEFSAVTNDVKIIFACPATQGGTPKFEIFTMNWGPFNGFIEKEQVEVADARGGENGKIKYRIFEYVPAVPFKAAETKFRVHF